MTISRSQIESILQAEDIEGLLSLGAPNDEYSHEAVEIKSALENLIDSNATEDRVSDSIANVWRQSFGLLSDDLEKRYPAFRQVAQRILESVQRS